MSKVLKHLDKQPVAVCAVISLLLNLVIEILSRRSFAETGHYIVHSPLLFLYNALIIMFTLTAVLVFKRRVFSLSIVSLLWLTCGIINCVVLSFRITPFSAVDLEILSSVKKIVKVYLSPLSMILIAVAILAVIFGLVMLWLKAPKITQQIHYIKTIAVIAVTGVSIVFITQISLSADALESSFPNIADAYEDYGFTYCFSNSIVDRGIDKPTDYSQEYINNITSQLNKKHDTNVTKPNIIVVQLESFIDLNTLKNVQYNENPNPTFSKLKEEYSSGYVTVPSIGAGTANTEFEILTGMSLDYFGSSEYPYKTVLRDGTCESICYNLKHYGYSSHAIHNNDATFYGRNTVYSNLGFDTFTSLEYMQNVEYNVNNWAKDNILTDEVMKALKSTDGQDFVFTVTVQSHGRYPSEVIDPTQKISQTGYKEELTNQLNYLANQIHDVDDFVNALITELNSFDEPSVVLFYGDHLPNLGITNDDLIDSNVFQTEYVIWDNLGLSKEDKDFNAFQLSSYLFDRLDLNGGVISQYHSSCADNIDYLDGLNNLEYDLLFGEKFAQNGETPYTATALHMGVDEIKVKSAYCDDEYFYVEGENFTEFSKILINGNDYDTTFISSSKLSIDKSPVDSGDTISVGQAGSDKVIISTGNEMIFG